MAGAVKVLSKMQIGKETTKGTLVAATRRLVGDGRFSRVQELHPFDDLDVGLYARTAQIPILTRQGAMFEFRTPVDFTQLLWPLLSGMKGGVTGVGAGADKTWTFTPATATGAVFDSYTLEFVESDGTNDAEMESGYLFCTEIEISGTTDGVGELRAQFAGRKATDSTLTGALTVPALTYAANLRWQGFVDSTFALMAGATPTAFATGQLYGFRWTWRDFIFPQYYLDGRVDLDFGAHESRRRTTELELDLVSDAAAAGFVQTQEAIKSAGTRQFIMMRLLGPTLGAANYKIDLQGSYVHLSDSMEQRGEDRDGNLVTRAHLGSIYDPTSTNDVQVIVVTDAATFP